MESRPKRNLDNPTFRGRLRGSRRAELLNRPHSAQFKGHMSDVQAATSAKLVIEPTATSLNQPRPQVHRFVDIMSSKKGITKSSSATPELDPHVSIEQRVAMHGPTALSSKHTPVSGDQSQLRSEAVTAQSPSHLHIAPKAGHIAPTHTPKKLPTRHTTPRPDLPKQKRSNVLKRELTKLPTHTSIVKHRRALMPALLSGMAVMLFVAGILVLINTLRTDHTVKAQVKQLTQKTETDGGISDGTPSETNPPSSVGNNDYQVASDLPRLLSIAKIDVSARVRRVGVGPNNVLNAPANIFDVGWYDGSAKPGENGTIVLDGHVSGPTKHGVFYSIGTLKSGDKINIERGDGKKFTYTVTGTQLFDNDKVDMTKVITSSVPGKPGLNLMTCAGRFNVRTNQFEQRVVVYSVQD